MKSMKWFILLTCVLPILGFVLLVVLTASSLASFSEILHQGTIPVDEMKAQTVIIAHQLRIGLWGAYTGILCSVVGILALAVRGLKEPPKPPKQIEIDLPQTRYTSPPAPGSTDGVYLLHSPLQGVSNKKF